MRLRAKKDANQAAIVRELEQAGYSVLDLSTVGRGAIDILVGGVDGRDGLRKAWPMEIKVAKGKLNPLQVEWHGAWRGPVFVVRTPAEALAVVGAAIDAALAQESVALAGGAAARGVNQE